MTNSAQIQVNIGKVYLPTSHHVGLWGAFIYACPCERCICLTWLTMFLLNSSQSVNLLTNFVLAFKWQTLIKLAAKAQYYTWL